jgi:hypothetical protein
MTKTTNTMTKTTNTMTKTTNTMTKTTNTMMTTRSITNNTAISALAVVCEVLHEDLLLDKEIIAMASLCKATKLSTGYYLNRRRIEYNYCKISYKRARFLEKRTRMETRWPY